MKKLFLLIVLLFHTILFFGQDLTLDKDNDTIIRKAHDPNFRVVTITVKNNVNFFKAENKIDFSVDNETSTLAKSEYDIITIKESITADNGQHKVIITIKPNTNNEVSKTIVLLANVYNKKGNKIDGIKQSVTVYVKSENDEISNFSYLAYVGTNFDLVDGIKAKNLFFAANVFLPPLEKGTIGVYLSLYGNRTLSSNDSLAKQKRLKEVNFDTAVNSPYAIFEQSDVLVKSQSDNLGAFFSPLLRLWNLSKAEKKFQVYYSPSLEFIWRRSFTELTYVNTTTLEPDYTAIQADEYEGPIVYNLQDKQILKNNIYDFNMGILGFFLAHENDKMSVRLNMNAGLTNRYKSSSNSLRGVFTRSGMTEIPTNYRTENDFFFSGRLWITERNSGITLQAEVTNNLNTPKPYYGVTLSKAMDFGKLGNIFKPISAGNTP